MNDMTRHYDRVYRAGKFTVRLDDHCWLVRGPNGEMQWLSGAAYDTLVRPKAVAKLLKRLGRPE